MILGASYSQIPLYETASRLGIATVAVSTPGDWPGFAVADECSYRFYTIGQTLCSIDQTFLCMCHVRWHTSRGKQGYMRVM